ncbi:MAG: flavodoxin [Clostridia bacterium]|jgi:menaquinone-dependent protoporphyrinogen oxidase|nr:flavodoxin [Clostridia bacterium]
MKTVIVYATKHGAAEKCAKMLKKKMEGDVSLIDLKQVKQLNVSEYDKVIIGGSIYAGTIQKEVTEFCRQNIQILKQKQVGLFITCMNESSADSQLSSVFPKELLDIAAAKVACGGEFNFKDMNFMEKLIIKMITKAQTKDNPNVKPINIGENISTLSEEKVNQLVNAMS